MSENESKFMRGMRTGGTLFENPIPDIEERAGQLMSQPTQTDPRAVLYLILGSSVLFVAAVVLTVAARALAGSVLATIAFIFLTRAFGGRRPGFVRSWVTAALTLLLQAFISLAGARALRSIEEAQPSNPLVESIANAVAYLVASSGIVKAPPGLATPTAVEIAAGLLALVGPAILLAAFIVKTRTGAPYAGRGGYLKAALASAVVLAAAGAGMWLTGLAISRIV